MLRTEYEMNEEILMITGTTKKLMLTIRMRELKFWEHREIRMFNTHMTRQRQKNLIDKFAQEVRRNNYKEKEGS